MQPINNIAAILILGLELEIIGLNEESNKIKIAGNVLILLGWILNIIAGILK